MNYTHTQISFRYGFERQKCTAPLVVRKLLHFAPERVSGSLFHSRDARLRNECSPKFVFLTAA